MDDESEKMILKLLQDRPVGATICSSEAARALQLCGADGSRKALMEPNTINEQKRLNLAYVHIMDGLAFGFHIQGEPMTLAEFRAEYGGIIMGN